jgi:FixJ family two-component response regulator
MVDGQWTLVERFDTDDKHFLLARRNAPHVAEHHKLTERERAIVERVALGARSPTWATSSGSARAPSPRRSGAMKRLGIETRAELMELRARLT